MASHPRAALDRPSRRTLANAIRALAMDAVQAARSGHPGAPMGMADIAEVLWNDYLRHNPANPRWPDRDRFVLSNGHGSMLLYALAHLSGYPLTIEELKNFRQMGARTAGHPELDLDIGVETTTGPLGQGITNAVGMALAEQLLGEYFNRPGHRIVEHRTYVFLGDGCLMEGISHEACSLAGTLKLGKLICFYDDNGISIDGEVAGWFADDTPARFNGYGWHVIPDVDGHDPEALRAAVDASLDDPRPSLICCKTVIGFGAPNLQGTAATHGSPLGDAEVAATRDAIGWTSPPFAVPDEVAHAWDARSAGAAREQEWQARFAAYAEAHPGLAEEFTRRMNGDLPANWAQTAAAALAEIAAEQPTEATRKSSLRALNALAPGLPELVGGSADLTGSNCTKHSESTPVTPDSPGGNYVYFGVREFGMAAMCNGLALHGGLIPYGGTFLTFSDYSRNALRMAALMRVQNIAVFTHDSIGLGEDGPTHQPVEHLASLQLIPNMRVWRPCDAAETLVAWGDAIERRDGPTCLLLTRQGLPAQARGDDQLANIRRGGYVLQDAKAPELVLIATGSEVQLAIDAAEQLTKAGRAVRVVSMPCVSLFKAQDAAYRDAVLPPSLTRRLAVEAGATQLWHELVGPGGRIIGIDRFGESAPAPELFAHFGFTVDNVVNVANEMLANS